MGANLAVEEGGVTWECVGAAVGRRYIAAERMSEGWISEGSCRLTIS